MMGAVRIPFAMLPFALIVASRHPGAWAVVGLPGALW
jgi:hypothetical protein